MGIDDSEKIRETPKVKPQEDTKIEQPQKTGQSAFDKILEQSKLLQQSPLNVQAATQKGSEGEVKEVKKQQDQEKGKDRDSEEKKEEKGKEKAKDKSETSRTVTREAVARAKGEKGSSGGGEGKKGGGGLGYQGKEKSKLTQLKKTGDARPLHGDVKGAQFQSQLKAAEGATRARMVQEIVNKIIQSVRVGINVDGEKEVRLDLKEEIFRGLRLRLATKRGKVSVHFLTSTASVRDLFEESASEIKGMLEKRGIAVEEIKVS